MDLSVIIVNYNTKELLKACVDSVQKTYPESEIIVATVSLFGTTEDMMLIETLTTDEADRLIAIAKKEGTAHLIKRLISAL